MIDYIVITIIFLFSQIFYSFPKEKQKKKELRILRVLVIALYLAYSLYRLFLNG
ncbi:hypothetical protein SAMN02745116_00837 [Pilibacter termitis]|uniref:Uncharacterized protein n=1 Tax=Pilibacter termitis TaxID=263852 RepID=A0A1T4LWP5_9ENTE|nr:hypothetical protein SAMN02745116_00837 [Pilibacter termitis]